MKIAVFIDGGNFYGKLKDLKIKHTSRFDFQAFLESITRGFQISFVGYYVGQVRKEKGVDVRIALDLYKMSAENAYDRAILLSSDSDLLPAVKMVQQNGKEVEYMGFSHLPSFALLKECKAKRLLNDQDIRPFEAKDLSP